MAIEDFANRHRQAQDDELAGLYEMNVYNMILGFMIENGITVGDYNIQKLFNKDEELYEDWFQILCDMHLDILMDPPPFEVHPDLKELFCFFDKAFWGDV